MSINYSIANYNGKQANNTAYIKNFVSGTPQILWKASSYNNIGVITPTSLNYDNLYIPGNLYVDGNIINPSDINIKSDINEINSERSDGLLKLTASEFTFKDDINKKVHYGFIAQDFEKYYPELVSIKPDNKFANIKAINYLEIIPLLVDKIQRMQKEIDVLKSLNNI